MPSAPRHRHLPGPRVGIRLGGGPAPYNLPMTTATTAPGQLTITDIQALAAADMAAVDQLIRERLSSDVVLINQISEHIIHAGGKRLRPMLVVLVARALGQCGADAHKLAAIIEFIHTSTLLHDDVVDQSDLRRGRKTANALWGNAPSVLVGDFLYSRSFQLMVELDSMPVMRLLADTTNRIAEGEVLQLLHLHNPDVDEAAYLRVIERKTAVLFAAATSLAALLAGADAATQQRMYDYGLNLGMAFQIADDVLDYTGDAAALGKNLGDDLAEGKATLPVIHALANCPPERRERLRELLAHGDLDALPEVITAIGACKSVAHCLRVAQAYATRADAALVRLPTSLHLSALSDLADYSISRSA